MHEIALSAACGSRTGGQRYVCVDAVLFNLMLHRGLFPDLIKIRDLLFNVDRAVIAVRIPVCQIVVATPT